MFIQAFGPFFFFVCTKFDVKWPLNVYVALWVSAGLKRKNLGVFEWLLMVFVLALILLFLPISIWFCVKVRTTP